MLEEFARSLYIADGPTVPFLGFPYPTRMVVIRLSDGSTWIWSPIALTRDLERAVDSIGPVRHIVSPNKIHHLFMKEWAERWPGTSLIQRQGKAGHFLDNLVGQRLIGLRGSFQFGLPGDLLGAPKQK